MNERMTAAQFRSKMGLPPPGVSHDHQTRSCLQGSKPQRDVAPALEQAQEGIGEGKVSARTRIGVRLTCFRVRTTDSDNLAGGSKAIVDQLRYCGLIPNDDPETIRLEVEQVKVSHFAEERTEVSLEYV